MFLILEEGVNRDECSQVYPGVGPNSEPETKNIVNFTTGISKVGKTKEIYKDIESQRPIVIRWFIKISHEGHFEESYFGRAR